MEGGRELFTCAKCGKQFFYWVPKANDHPKVVCYFCGETFFPKGEPPAAPAPAPDAAKPAPLPS